MKQFHLKIATPDGQAFDGMADSLLVKCELGDVEIMAGHADFFSSLGVGRARIKVDGKDRLASCAGGFISVDGGKVQLVATTFEFSENIDVKRAIAAKEAAEKAIRDAADDMELERAKLKLSRALNRIKVSEIK